SCQAAERFLAEIGMRPEKLGTEELKEAVRTVNVEQMANKQGIGVPPLNDMIDALVRPGRDPRDDLPKPKLKKGVLSLEDLSTGMEPEGTVRNVVDFGVFVDIGVKEDGLIHISKLSRRYVKHPLEVVS